MLQRLFENGRRRTAVAIAALAFAIGVAVVAVLLTSLERSALAATTVVTQPTDLRRYTDFIPGGAVPLAGFAVTATAGERLTKVTVRVDAVAGSTIAPADFSYLAIALDSASPGADEGEGPFDDYTTGSPTDDSGVDDTIGSAAVTALGVEFDLSVAATARTAGKNAYPVSMAGRGTYEFTIWAAMASGATATTKQFTLSVTSITSETSDGGSGGASGTDLTTATIGPPGWLPSATSGTITVAQQTEDLGLRGFSPAGAGVPYLGFALTSSGSDTLAAVTVRVNAPEGSTIVAGDFDTIALATDSAAVATDWHDGPSDFFFGSTAPADNANADDLINDLVTMSIGSDYTLNVSGVAVSSGKHALPTSMSGRGSHEFHVVVSLVGGATDATDQFTLTFVNAKCRTSSGTLVNCGLNAVTTGTISPDTTPPVLSGGAPLDGEGSFLPADNLTINANERLPNVSSAALADALDLRTCTTSACTATTGGNRCTTVSLSADSSGNPARTLTCAHAELAAATPYQLTVSGITDAVGNAYVGSVVRKFQTAGGITATVDATPPAAPSVAAASATDTAVTLTWTDPGDADFTGVRVLRKRGEASDLLGVVPKGTRTYMDTDVAPETSYAYGLRAVDTAGNQSVEVALAATTLAAGSALPVDAPSVNLPPVEEAPETLSMDRTRADLEATFSAALRDRLSPEESDALVTFLATGAIPQTDARTPDDRMLLLRTFARIYGRLPAGAVDGAILTNLAERPARIPTIAAHLEAAEAAVPVFQNLQGGRKPGTPSPAAPPRTPEEIATDFRTLRIIAHGVDLPSRNVKVERTVFRFLIDHVFVFTGPDGRPFIKPRGAVPPAPVYRQALRMVRACAYGDPEGCPWAIGARGR